MAYLHGAARAAEGLGCGSGCGCSSCRGGRIGEIYERPDVSGYFAEAATPALPAERVCPEPARTARDRCGTPQPCPAIPDLICVRGVAGVPFEYVSRVRRDPSTGLLVPQSDIGTRPPRLQRFVPGVRTGLSRVLGMLDRWGMPAEAILTAGSLYCRCIRNTSRLSNHSFGDAIDIVGFRWRTGANPGSRLRETIVHNYRDPAERALLIRLNAILRLAFPTVIDYFHRDHRDHFHCDLNQGRGPRPIGRGTVNFIQEALGVALRRPVRITGVLDGETRAALNVFSGRTGDARPSAGELRRMLDTLFRSVGSAGRER